MNALKNSDGEQLYTHEKTGAIDTKEGWICSYTLEELEERGLSAKQAFQEDLGETLFETPIPDLDPEILEDFEHRAKQEKETGTSDLNVRSTEATFKGV